MPSDGFKAIIESSDSKELKNYEWGVFKDGKYMFLGYLDDIRYNIKGKIYYYFVSKNGTQIAILCNTDINYLDVSDITQISDESVIKVDEGINKITRKNTKEFFKEKTEKEKAKYIQEQAAKLDEMIIQDDKWNLDIIQDDEEEIKKVILGDVLGMKPTQANINEANKSYDNGDFKSLRSDMIQLKQNGYGLNDALRRAKNMKTNILQYLCQGSCDNYPQLALNYDNGQYDNSYKKTYLKYGSMEQWQKIVNQDAQKQQQMETTQMEEERQLRDEKSMDLFNNKKAAAATAVEAQAKAPAPATGVFNWLTSTASNLGNSAYGATTNFGKSLANTVIATAGIPTGQYLDGKQITRKRPAANVIEQSDNLSAVAKEANRLDNRMNEVQLAKREKMLGGKRKSKRKPRRSRKQKKSRKQRR